MNDQQPVIVLVHGACADSASWNGVLERLQAKGLDTVALANPLRTLSVDAAFARETSMSGSTDPSCSSATRTAAW